MVYASSSSVYGEQPDAARSARSSRPRRSRPTRRARWRASSTRSVWHRLFGVETVGLRYFNVFGPRQDPQERVRGGDPALHPLGLRGEPLEVHGDGTQSRDFTYIDNVVSANLLAAAPPPPPSRARATTWAAAAGRACSRSSSMIERRARPPRRAAGTRPAAPATCRTRSPTSARPSATSATSPSWSFEEGLRRTVDFFSGE